MSSWPAASSRRLAASARGWWAARTTRVTSPSNLGLALAEPGGEHDVVLEAGDRLIVPSRTYMVKVIGEVGFPTSLVWEEGRNINHYVDRAGGYLKNADKGRSRLVHPNGMSLPNKGDSEMVGGSTVLVPLKPPPEGKTTLETVRDRTGIVASLAMAWLVIDNTAN